MYSVKVRDFISSAHYLREYKGKCENLHGHNWEVEVTVEKKELASDGMVIDFKELKKYLKEIVDQLDHKVINDEVEYFKTHNPSAENLSKYIYDLIQEKVVNHGAKVKQVDVWEQRDSRASYYE